MLTKKDHYALTKEMLFAKFNGRCAFCGDGLGGKWQIWDIEPKNAIVTHAGELIMGNDSYENKLPACVSCNMTRVHHSGSKDHKMNIEKFRSELAFQFNFLFDNNYFKKAVRYGIVEQVKAEIVFYFEALS